MITLTSETRAPDRAEIGPMLDASYTEGVAQLVAAGGPNLDPTPFKDEFWEEVSDFLPPMGRFFTARAGNGELVGYGSLRTIENGVGELKRLYVWPAARGQRLERRLVEARISAAREMGLVKLRADTWHNNAPMLDMYKSLGFQRIELFEDSATFRLMPHVAPFMAFVEMALDG